ncbi:MAG: flagellar basal-body rod protein FlgF [Desulfobacterales bacterium]|jgi:flagellar basal-body rod protein FlgG
MSGSIYMAATGALAYEKQLQLLSNNLANVNTVGFKKDRGRFREFNLAKADATENLPLQSRQLRAPEYWMDYSTYTDFSAGALKKTGNPFDLALAGHGFFCVQTPDGIMYTRRGDFTIDADEVLVTQEGWPVLGRGGEIQIKLSKLSGDKREFSISEDGTVTVDGAQVDRLRIIDFTQSHALEKAGHNYYRALKPQMLEELDEELEVSQGFLELSNVDTIRMMTEMIEVLRGYESYQKIMRSVDDMNAKLINDVGRSA